jgi:hypothetical protein
VEVGRRSKRSQIRFEERSAPWAERSGDGPQQYGVAPPCARGWEGVKRRLARGAIPNRTKPSSPATERRLAVALRSEEYDTEKELKRRVLGLVGLSLFTDGRRKRFRGLR